MALPRLLALAVGLATYNVGSCSSWFGDGSDWLTPPHKRTAKRGCIKETREQLASWFTRGISRHTAVGFIEVSMSRRSLNATNVTVLDVKKEEKDEEDETGGTSCIDILLPLPAIMVVTCTRLYPSSRFKHPFEKLTSRLQTRILFGTPVRLKRTIRCFSSDRRTARSTTSGSTEGT